MAGFFLFGFDVFIALPPKMSRIVGGMDVKGILNQCKILLGTGQKESVFALKGDIVAQWKRWHNQGTI